MDGFSTGLTHGVAGALASHEAARHQLARETRRRRLSERRGPTDAHPDADDGPVEETYETPSLTNQFPHHPPARASSTGEDEEQHPHLDLTA